MKAPKRQSTNQSWNESWNGRPGKMAKRPGAVWGMILGMVLGMGLLAGPGSAAQAGEAMGVETKLKTIIVPKLEISDVNVADFFNHVSMIVRESDGARDERQRGVNIVLDLDAADKEKRLSWRGHKKSVRTILDDACLQAGLVWSVRNGLVWVSSVARHQGLIRSKVFKVEPVIAPMVKEDGSRGFLEKRGLKFPDGASSGFDAATGQLLVKNTAANLGQVEGILAQAVKQASAARNSRKPGLKGGAFADEEVFKMHGGRVADDKAIKGRSVGSLTTSFTDDMATYEDAIQQRALAAQQAELAARYDRIVIPEMEFNNTQVKDALKMLEDIAYEYAQQSRRGDEDYQTVMRISEEEAAQTVTLSARNLPLMQAVRAILSATNLRYRLQGRSLIVYSPAPTT